MNINFSIFSINYKKKIKKITGIVPAIKGIIMEEWMNSLNQYLKAKYFMPIIKKENTNIHYLQNKITAEETLYYLMNVFIKNEWQILKISNSNSEYKIIFLKQLMNVNKLVDDITDAFEQLGDENENDIESDQSEDDSDDDEFIIKQYQSNL